MRLIITENMAADWAAVYVAEKIRNFAPTKDKPFVLGLPTGGTPLAMYKRLIAFHKAGLVSFEHVITFNMDEYLGLDASNEQSYHYYMWENFFKHIDIKEENVHILDGMAEDYEAECRAFEEKIEDVGGIHLFLGGVGEDGHIAFNEPGSSLTSRTRKMELTKDTIDANARFFGNDTSLVPKSSLTVGIGTIMDADEVLIMVTGAKKARALQHGVEGGISHLWAISALQMHERAIIVADEPACAELKVSTYKYFKDIEADQLDVEKQIQKLTQLTL